MESNTILITGGASGIGLALAERFQERGNRVLVCGRREEKLREARARLPNLEVHVADLEKEAERRSLADWAITRFPDLNVLVNNAGIQRYPELAKDSSWEGMRTEIAINLDAPIHLTSLFLPHLLKQPRAAVVNVTSGLAFVPIARAPVYSATKAALHSFTRSLRQQLSATTVEVVEIIPPAVDTDLGGPGLHTFGVSVDDLADHVMASLAKGEVEIAYGFAQQASRGSREELEVMFARMNQGTAGTTAERAGS
jgi:uncharacterized oxidoreductase